MRGQGRQGAYDEVGSIHVLGVENPSEYLLPRRDEYTRVYTTVYPRVHNSVQACTLPCSKYRLVGRSDRRVSALSGGSTSPGSIDPEEETL